MSVLKFMPANEHTNNMGNQALRFRERGWTVISNVYERGSVDAYREMLCSRVRETGNPNFPLELPHDNPDVLDVAKAPRLLAALRKLFDYDGHDVAITVFHPTWLVKPAEPNPNIVHGWHKDGDHDCFHSIFGYSFPRRIHAWIPLEDVTVEHGPTYVIPGSHRDINKSPYIGKLNEEPLMCQKQDVVLWDQRMWHRASPRTIPGYRLIAIFGFTGTIHGVPRPIAQKEAFKNATTDEERILFGGYYANDPID